MLDHDLADRGDRLVAQFLDSFFAILIVLISLMFAYASDVLAPAVITLGFVAALLYILCADGLTGGQSYGKQVMKICVIDATTGRPCSVGKSFFRNITLAFLGIFDWIFIFSEKRQRLGDLIANTIVVKKNHRSRDNF